MVCFQYDRANAAFRKHAFNLYFKINQQPLNGRETIRSSFVSICAMPVVMPRALFLIVCASRRNAMSIIETDKSVTVWIMERKRVAKPMRSLWRGVNSFNLEFEPVILLEMVD